MSAVNHVQIRHERACCILLHMHIHVCEYRVHVSVCKQLLRVSTYDDARYTMSMQDQDLTVICVQMSHLETDNQDKLYGTLAGWLLMPRAGAYNTKSSWLVIK